MVCSGPIVGPIIVPFNPRKRAQKQKRMVPCPGLSGIPAFGCCRCADVVVPASPPRRSDAAKDAGAPSDNQTALLLSSQSHSSITSVSEFPVVRDVFALKLQEVMCIPHQSHDSVTAQLTKWSCSDNYLPFSAQFGLFQ
jgi:hypothetical protein